MNKTISPPHPHAIIGDFVKKYEENIRPSLRIGFLDKEATAFIRYCFDRKKHVDLSQGNLNAISRYSCALELLTEIAQNPKFPETIFQAIDRSVSETEIILGDDSYYKTTRGQQNESR